MTVPIDGYLGLAAVVFAIAAVGALTRRNGLTLLLSIELMLGAANLYLVAAGRRLAAETGAMAAAVDGRMVVMLVVLVVLAQLAVGLALLFAVLRNRRSIDVDRMHLMRW